MADEPARLADTVADGDDLIASWPRDHSRDSVCPACLESCSRVGVTHLAYRFAVCDCDKYPYSHLVEQVWHLLCMVENADTLVKERVILDAIERLESYASKGTKLIGANLREWLQAHPIALIDGADVADGAL